MKLPTKLKSLFVSEGSLVDKGANEEAKVVFFKRDLAKSESPMKTDDGKKFPKSDYAYTPSDNVSEWKLRLTSDPGGEPDAGIIGAALAALGPGFRGNKVQIPSDALPDVKTRVKAAWMQAHADATEEDIPSILRKGGEENMDTPAIEDIGLEVEAVMTGLDIHLDELKKAGKTISKDTSKTLGEILGHMQMAMDRMKTIMPETVAQEAIDRKDVWEGSEDMSISDEVRDSLPEEVQKHLEEVEKKAAEVDELSAKPEDIWKGVNPKVKAEFEVLEKKAEAADKLAKAEHEARISKEYADEAKALPHIGSVEDVAKMLRNADELSADDGDKLRKTLKAAQAKIDANDKLTTELGNSSSDGSGAFGKIEALATELRKSQIAISQEQAIAKVLTTPEGKELYDEYQKEGSVN